MNRVASRGGKWIEDGDNLIGIRFVETPSIHSQKVANDLFVLIKAKIAPDGKNRIHKIHSMYLANTEAGVNEWTDSDTGEFSDNIGGVAQLRPGDYNLYRQPPSEDSSLRKYGFYSPNDTLPSWRDGNKDGYINFYEKNKTHKATSMQIHWMGSGEYINNNSWGCSGVKGNKYLNNEYVLKNDTRVQGAYRKFLDSASSKISYHLLDGNTVDRSIFDASDFRDKVR